MDDNFRHILNTLPEMPPRSRLEPYSELINELRQRGRTYREIAHILAEECQLKTAASTIHDFLRSGSRISRESVKPQARHGTTVTRARRAHAGRVKGPLTKDVEQRIANLKARPAPAKASLEHFQYDPDEPLHLPGKGGN